MTMAVQSVLKRFCNRHGLPLQENRKIRRLLRGRFIAEVMKRSRSSFRNRYTIRNCLASKIQTACTIDAVDCIDCGNPSTRSFKTANRDYRLYFWFPHRSVDRKLKLFFPDLHDLLRIRD